MAPRNGVHIVQGEMSLVVSALRRNARWGSHSRQDEEQDPLLHGFSQLKDQLCSVSDLSEVDVNTFLGPFLDVIRSEDTTGPITGVALSSVNKFLSYGLVDPSSESAASGIENLADAVTHARFVGTDPSSDEVVLMKILQVLRTLLLTPVGAHMTNESVCEIMQSCFRICFEIRLSELLRRSAEQTLMDMIQLLFSRLPQFKEEAKTGLVANIRKVFKRAGAIATGKRKKHVSPKPKRATDNVVQMIPQAESQVTPTVSTNVPQPLEPVKPGEKLTQSEVLTETVKEAMQEEEYCEEQCEVVSDEARADADEGSQASVTSVETLEHSTAVEPSVASQIMSRSDGEGNIVEGSASEENQNGEKEESQGQVSHESVASKVMMEVDLDENKDSLEESGALETETCDDPVEVAEHTPSEPSSIQDEYVNPRGVRFMPQEPAKEGAGPLVPYGLPCVRELFRFLISLINPQDRHNSDPMIHMGLSLLTVALESGGHHIGTFSSLMNIVKDDLCKNLFLLLQCEVLGLFAMSLRVCFLLFEGLRVHLKFQMEMFYKKLMDILAMDMQSVHYEKRELILDAINQLFRVPNLVTELYLNYDCDLYCTNVFEELCKLLSKNAFPAGSLYTVHILALDALLAVVQTVESHCHASLLNTMEKAIEDSIPVAKTKKSGDDDSGTDENCDSPTMPSPPTSGYAMARKMTVGAVSDEQSSEQGAERSDHEADAAEEKPQQVCAGGLLFASSLPTPESLGKLKKRKKLLQAGTEQFNTKPKKGIEFLQEHGLLSTPLDPEEVVKFLRENPRLDKKTIGEFIGDKRNNKFLSAFVRSFHFHHLRVDEGLRAFLEAFRLPGESPVIEHIMEFFSEVFYECNHEQYANKDAVFTLAYAVIMLNVDQHNTNIKQQKPMTVDEFKRNLRKTNGGEDFPAAMLEETYHAIKNEEIVMPSERSGRIRENYEWKVLLRRSSTAEGQYVNGMGSCFDQDLFLIIWGPTVAALSYVYDNGLEKSVVQKAIVGYRKCALISAHYNQTYVFDNLVISLCKFTALLTSESTDALPVAFGSNPKAQQSARTLFALAHRHGDILREGWKNIMDCMLQLFKAKLLPKSMIEAEDFVETSGKVNLLPEEMPSARQDTTLMSWYQYFVNPEPSVARGQTAEDKEAQKHARVCISDCHPELLITESKFLRFESLNELIKVLIFTSSMEHQESSGGQYDEEATVFFLELLIRVVLQNRDRVSLLWHTIRDHLSNIIVNASVQSRLVERAVVGLLRLAIRLLRKEEISSQVLITLRVLLMMKVTVLQACARQISYGLHELLRTNAASITTARDWVTVFTLLECVGASVTLPTVTQGPPIPTVTKETDNDSIAGDFELTDGISTSESDVSCIESESGVVGNGDSWLVITKEDPESSPASQYDLQVSVRLNKHDSKAFVKACQSLTFLIRDGAHVTRENFLQCVHAVRVFAEASLNGGLNFRKDEQQQQQQQQKENGADYKGTWGRNSKKNAARSKKMSPGSLKNRKAVRSAGNSPSSSEDEAEMVSTINNTYDAMSLQLIELMHVLHTKAASFFDNSGPTVVEAAQPVRRDSVTEVSVTNGEGQGGVTNGVDMNFLWTKCWCLLLQGIARSCCDVRREVRMSALTFLQRALLIQDLQALTAMEWEACFNKVLFPMLTCLLEVNNPSDPVSLEETRMRATTLLCRVFLQHLTQLLSLTTFTALWLTILDFMDKYMHADKSDLLFEAIPESLKNMLLVMSTAGIFDEEDCAITSQSQASGARRTHRRTDSDARKLSALWQVTWERIDCFLPNLKQELFTPRSKPAQPSSPQAPPAKASIASVEPPNQPEEVKSRVAEDTPAKPDVSSTPSSPSHSITSPPSGGQQVCVVLQPPLPSLNNRSSSPTQLGSLADNVRPASVPIILAPSPSLVRGQAIPGSGSVTPPEVIGPISREETSSLQEDESSSDVQEGQEQKPDPPKAPVYDI